MAARCTGLQGSLLRHFCLYTLLLYFLLWHFCLAIYEDQVGLFDWRQQYVGEVKYLYFDQYSHSSRRAIVATKSNVIAALNARTGALVWRHVLDQKEDEISSLLHFSNVLISVSGKGKTLRSWDPVKGHLIWESIIQDTGSSNSRSSHYVSQLASKLVVKKSGSFSGILTLNSDKLFMHSVKTGDEAWTFTSSQSSDTTYQGFGVDGDNAVLYGVSEDRLLMFKVFDVETGKLVAEKSLGAPWLADGRSKFILVNEKYLVILHMQERQLFVVNLSEFTMKSTLLELIVDLSMEKGEQCELQNVAGHIEETTEFLFSCQQKFLLKVDQETLGVQYARTFQEGSLVVSTMAGSKSIILVATNRDVGGVVLDIAAYHPENYSEILALRQSVTFSSVHGSPQKGVLFAFSRKDNDIGFRLLLVNKDESLCLIQHSGKVLWEREEALSGITVVEMVELPPATSEAKLELLHEEFSLAPNAGVISMFMKRIRVQLKQLEVFMRSLKKRKQFGEVPNDEKDDSEKLTRDQFNLHKVLVVMTKVGKLYGIDSSGGTILWTHFLQNMRPFTVKGEASHYLFTQRTTAHFPLPPQCIVFGTHVSAEKSMLYAFNPLNGKAIESIDSQGALLPFHILQVSVVPFTDEKFTKVALVLDQERHVHIYPQTEESLEHMEERMKSIYLYLIDQELGTLQGFAMKKEGKVNIGLEEAWTVRLPADQKIEKIVHKRLDEHVHSVGRVLGDRSVLYKYLNPNLVAIATLSGEGPKSFLSVYVIDAVTGQIVHHSRHRHAVGPIEMVLSEHWLIYVYSNFKARRSEVVVVELFEGFDEKNSTAFSSLDLLLHPMVLTQSYVLPFASVTKMDVTNTLRGITHKNLLLALESGYVYALPKSLLDPRRSFDHTPDLMEEGLMPYMPELPLNPIGFINYNLTVEKIRGIHTFSAGLESTSLVLVYGLDVFYTRVTPSRMFDVLKEDFDYIFTSGVLSALILATIISSKLASMRTLKLAWM